MSVNQTIMALLYRAGKHDASAMRAHDARVRRTYAECAGKDLGTVFKLLNGDLYIGQQLEVRIKARCTEFGTATRHVYAEVIHILPNSFMVKLLPEYEVRYKMEGWKWIFVHNAPFDTSQSMQMGWGN